MHKTLGRFCSGGLLAAALTNGLPAGLLAQAPGVSATSLSTDERSEAGQSSGTGLRASIEGTVQDRAGAILGGVRLELVPQNGTGSRLTVSGGSGAFSFEGLSPGSYLVKIGAADRRLAASVPITIGAGEQRELVLVAIPTPLNVTVVEVKASLNEVALEQIKEQEHQRILGVLPNFYTSYIWNAAPMPSKLKFELAVRALIDPVSFLAPAGVAAVQQERNRFPGYGQGSEGYAKRFGASYADAVAFRVLGSAIFPAILHQDPRYFYRGSGSPRSRILYALLATVICRGDNGRLEPNFSRALGSFSAAGLSNVYRAPADRSLGRTLRNGIVIMGTGSITNVLREFLSRRLTPGVPSFARGKP